MSLKFFHIFFITLATLLAFGCGAKAFLMFRADGGSTHLCWGILGIIAGVALLVYGAWFLRKSKNIIL